MQSHLKSCSDSLKTVLLLLLLLLLDFLGQQSMLLPIPPPLLLFIPILFKQLSDFDFCLSLLEEEDPLPLLGSLSARQMEKEAPLLLLLLLPLLLPLLPPPPPSLLPLLLWRRLTTSGLGFPDWKLKRFRIKDFFAFYFHFIFT